MKPVGVGAFLNDDKVQDIINAHSGGVIIEPGYENPEDIPPELSDGAGPLADGDLLTVFRGRSVTITVTNAADYDGGIEWFYGENRLGNGGSYTVNTASPPFNEEGTYQLAVKGTADGKPYLTEIFIKVE